MAQKDATKTTHKASIDGHRTRVQSSDTSLSSGSVRIQLAIVVPARVAESSARVAISSAFVSRSWDSRNEACAVCWLSIANQTCLFVRSLRKEHAGQAEQQKP